MRQLQQKSSAFLVFSNVYKASKTNGVNLDQTVPILNTSVILGNYLHFQTHFFLGALRVNLSYNINNSPKTKFHASYSDFFQALLL